MSVRTDGKVSGRTVEVAVEGVMSVFRRRIRGMLDDQGITDPDPREDEWYEMEDFLAVLESVAEDAGTNAVTKIGETTPEFVEWPEEPDGPVDALSTMTEVYEANHRNAPGGYEVESAEAGTVTVSVDTPYPCAFDEGLVKGTVEKHGGDYPRIEEVGDSCRAEGGDSCVYRVEW
jgi:predicted hydrocarbon binding protein